MSANDKKMHGTGLEDVGVPGQMFLRDALTSCTDPLKAIEEFQVSYLYNKLSMALVLVIIFVNSL